LPANVQRIQYDFSDEEACESLHVSDDSDESGNDVEHLSVDVAEDVGVAITRAYQFPLLLSLPAFPPPSSSDTKRPLWVRVLLTSRVD